MAKAAPVAAASGVTITAGAGAAGVGSIVATELAVFVGKLALAAALGRIAQTLLVRTPERNGQSGVLLGLPIGNADPGAPRVWAIGQRVRVPLQVIWQTRKQRQQTFDTKKGSGPAVRHVTADVALALNDRETLAVEQVIMADSLVAWSEFNIFGVETSEMAMVESGGQIIVSANTTSDPDFYDAFEVGDVVENRGWIVNTGAADPNVGYWIVIAVTRHTSATPSTMTLGMYQSSIQTVAGLDVTAGNAFAPAGIFKVLDALVSANWSWFVQPGTQTPGYRYVLSETGLGFDNVFRVGDTVTWPGDLSTLGHRVDYVSADQIWIRVGNGAWGTGPVGTGATDAGVLTFWGQHNAVSGIVPQNYDLQNYFYHGDDTQLEDVTITDAEGVGAVGGFRGTAYLVIPGIDLTNFGNVLPPQIEATISPDGPMNWQEAIRETCVRHGLKASSVDATGVTPRPFRGMYLRGPTTGVRALQQLLVIGQIATQDRNGVLSFFEIDNADVVQIQNGSIFSDFGAAVLGQIESKWVIGDTSRGELPTSMGIRFQDPDNQYGDNYEHFGLRNPSGPVEENQQELDFRNVVMSRKEARNLAATVLRRAQINSTPFKTTLPPSYLHILENDLVTFTDDDGNDMLVRITKREIGSNFLVRVEGVVERANIAVTGSPVQTGTGGVITEVPSPAVLNGVVFDGPAVEDQNGLVPGLHIVVAAAPGSSFGGCAVYVSQDNGANYSHVETITQEHAVGTLASSLAAATASEAFGSTVLTWDTTNSVDLELDAVGQVPLVSVPTEQDVVDGWNWFAVLDSGAQVVEVFGARDVVQNSATNYTLSHLLRGLRGTWQGCAAAHAAGLRVVGVSFFYALTGKFWALPSTLGAQPLVFKFVAPGRDLASSTPIGVTPTLRNVQPFPLRDVTKQYDASDDSILVEVSNWTRRNLPPGTLGPYPLDDPPEAYKFTLWDPTGQFPVLVRTVTAQGSGSPTLRDPSYRFTSAEQTAAGYTPGAGTTHWLDVQQIGQQIGSRVALSPSVLQVL